MRRMVTSPDTRNYFKVTNFHELDDILHRLLNDILKQCTTKALNPAPTPAPAVTAPPRGGPVS